MSITRVPERAWCKGNAAYTSELRFFIRASSPIIRKSDKTSLIRNGPEPVIVTVVDNPTSTAEYEPRVWTRRPGALPLIDPQETRTGRCIQHGRRGLHFGGLTLTQLDMPEPGVELHYKQDGLAR
jgi:hypothetical protein